MNIIKKKNENRLPTPEKVKKGFRYYCALVAGDRRKVCVIDEI